MNIARTAVVQKSREKPTGGGSADVTVADANTVSTSCPAPSSGKQGYRFTSGFPASRSSSMRRKAFQARNRPAILT